MGLDMYLTRRNKAKELEVEIYYWRKFGTYTNTFGRNLTKRNRH